MAPGRITLRRLARAAAGLAVLVGGYGTLYLLGAFGPVSCWRGSTASGSAARNGTVTTTAPTPTSGCESGIDVLLGGSAGGNAGVLFSWGLALFALVAVGGYAAWTGRRYVTWGCVLVGACITVVGAFSIGWYFLLPTVLLAAAAAARSVEARDDG